MRSRGIPWAGWALYAAVAAVHLGFQAVAPHHLGARATQAVLAPILLVLLSRAVPAPRGHLFGWTGVALGFCFLGDFLPALVADDLAFWVMIGAFLIAQICFIVAFWPEREGSFLKRRPAWLTIYAAALITLTALVGPRAGSLLTPILLYGLILTVMAVLASGLGVRGAVGGVLFLVSDALIAIKTFDVRVPAEGFLIMVTYASALGLLVSAVANRGTQTTRSATSA